MTFAAIIVTLFAPRADQAYTTAIGFMIGSVSTVAICATLKFAVLPNVETFTSFGLIIGFVLVPVGTFLALQWQPAIFTGIVTPFIPVLAPANPMSYDTQQFYNASLAIVAGVGAGAFSFRLLPPLSPAFRTYRLLALTLRDLRRLATGRIPDALSDWQGRIYGRLVVLPDQAQPLQRSQLMAAFTVGTEIIRLRHTCSGLNLGDLDATLEAVRRGNCAITIARLADLDRALTARTGAAALRARGLILAISQALTQHSSYF
jgi:uncharacterized membrane protein YccC